MTSTALTVPDWAQKRGLAIPNSAPTPLAMAASGGVGGNAPFPHISINQSRWRLVDTDGTEQVLQTFAIGFAIVAINPIVSKTYYPLKRAPGDEPTAPTCYSDDGVMPAEDADEPQSDTCASCEWNKWGSDVNENNGKKLKKCKDTKRLALVFPHMLKDDKPQLYMWRLPAMSMIAFSEFAKEVSNAGSALDFILIKAEFDETAEYLRIKFSVARNLTEDEYNVVQALRESDDAQLAIGKGPKVIPLVERVEPMRQPSNGMQATLNPLANQAAQQAHSTNLAAAQGVVAGGIGAEPPKRRRGRPTLAERAQGQMQEQKAQTAFAPAPAPTPAPKNQEFSESEMFGVGAQADAFASAQTTLQGVHASRDARTVTDVVPKDRSPVNVQNPAPASSELEALLNAALNGQ